MKRTKITICLIAILALAFTMFPLSASAQSYTHYMYYNLGGGSLSTAKTFTARDNYDFYLASGAPYISSKYRFKGYYAYRMKDRKWFVSGKGWQTSNYGAKLYPSGGRYNLNSSWTNGCKDSNYTFYAQYDFRHYCKFAGKNNKLIKGTNVWDGEYIYTPKSGLGRDGNGNDFLGWYVKRLSDNKYFTTGGHGWQTSSAIQRYGYAKKYYQPNSAYRLDGSWTKGMTRSNYNFYPAWGTWVGVDY